MQGFQRAGEKLQHEGQDLFFVPALQAGLGQLQVPVAELVPHEGVKRVLRLGEVVLRHGGFRLPEGFGVALHYPAVRQFPRHFSLERAGCFR